MSYASWHNNNNNRALQGLFIVFEAINTRCVCVRGFQMEASEMEIKWGGRCITWLSIGRDASFHCGERALLGRGIYVEHELIADM